MRDLLLNLIGFSGMVSLGVGLWWMYPPLTLVVLGLIFISVSIAGVLWDVYATSPKK